MFSVTLDPGENPIKLDFANDIEVRRGEKYWLVASAVDLQSSLGWYWNGVAEILTNTGPVLRHDSRSNLWVDESPAGQQAFRINAEKYSRY